MPADLQLYGIFGGVGSPTAASNFTSGAIGIPATPGLTVLMLIALGDLTTTVTSLAPSSPSASGDYTAEFVARRAGSNRRYELWALHSFKDAPSWGYTVTYSASTPRFIAPVHLIGGTKGDPITAAELTVTAELTGTDTAITWPSVTTAAVDQSVLWFGGWDNTGDVAARGTALTDGTAELASLGSTGQRIKVASRLDIDPAAVQAYSTPALAAAYAWTTFGLLVPALVDPIKPTLEARLIKGRRTATDDAGSVA